MAYGEGSIKRIGKDKYEIRLDFPKDALTGKRKEVRRRISGSRQDAVKALNELRRQRDGGLRIEGSKTPLTSLIDDWTKARELVGKASSRTITSERRALRHVERYIGDNPIGSITPQAIEDVYSRIKEEIGLSNTTIKQIHNSLKSVFARAVDFDYIMRNPCDRVNAPSRNKSNRKALTVEEATRLLSFIEIKERQGYSDLASKEQRRIKRGDASLRGHVTGVVNLSYLIGTRIALATGMRRGEIFGLTWEAFDMKTSRLVVNQSLLDTGEVKEPKTEAGYRSVTIDERTAKSLRKWKIFQEFLFRNSAVKQTEAMPICCSNTGGYVSLSNFEHWWKKFRVECGFPNLRFHELRHTHASHLLQNGIDIKTVQERLGHANPSMTMGYTHQVSQNDIKAAALIGNLFMPNASTHQDERKKAS